MRLREGMHAENKLVMLPSVSNVLSLGTQWKCTGRLTGHSEKSTQVGEAGSEADRSQDRCEGAGLSHQGTVLGSEGMNLSCISLFDSLHPNV